MSNDPLMQAVGFLKACRSMTLKSFIDQKEIPIPEAKGYTGKGQSGIRQPC